DAPRHEHILDPPGDVQVAVAVQVAEVPGTEPAIAPEGIRRRLAQVPGRDRRATHPHLTDFTAGPRHAGRLDDRYLMPGYRAPAVHGIGGVASQPAREAHGEGRLSQPVSGGHRRRVESSR